MLTCLHSLLGPSENSEQKFYVLDLTIRSYICRKQHLEDDISLLLCY